MNNGRLNPDDRGFSVGHHSCFQDKFTLRMPLNPATTVNGIDELHHRETGIKTGKPR